MSSWVSLLVLLAACVRFGAAEGDPLPAALVELVRTSPISSIEDLQLLLFSDSVGEDADSQSTDGQHANSSYIRLPRSLEAQPAQQAQCKVRTEVTEVTRGMLDRSNANFLLWPPCVEVQRCSGCCNTKSLHCVPVLTHTRYLQVMRIQYINKRPHYDKAVVSVSDHVECRCEPAPRSAGGSKKKHRQGHKERAGKSQTKEELHHQDQLKHNQRVQLHDLLKGSPWQHDGDTSLKSPHGWGDAGGMGAGEGDLLLPDRVHHGKKVAQRPHSSHNETTSVQAWEKGESEVTGHRHSDGERKWGHHSDRSVDLESSTIRLQHHPETASEDGAEVSRSRGGGGRVGGRGHGYHIYTHSAEEELGVETQIHHPVQHHRHDLSKMAAAANKKLTQASRTNQSAAHHLSPTHREEFNQSEDDNQNHKARSANQTHGQSISPTEVTNHSSELKDNPTQGANQWTEDRPSPTELTNQRATSNETPDSERKHEGRQEEEGEAVEEERRELLLLHRRLDQEKELLNRQRQQEEDLQHTPAQQHTTTIRTDTTATTTTTTTTTRQAPARPHRPRAPPRPPPRPHPHPSKRRRKHRNRISKAAMRAMLM